MRGLRGGRSLARAPWYSAALLGLALPATAGGGLSMTVSPESLGPGDHILVTVNAPPGEWVVMMTSIFPGPTDFPFIGTMGVGPAEIDYVFLGPFGETGQMTFQCTLSCLVNLSPVYAQAASFTLDGGVTLTDKTPQMAVTYDPELVQDCNENLIDDDCEELDDCDGNGIPDVCDLADGTLTDEDGDGFPDECCPELCKLRTRFTFEGPMPDPPFFLSIWVMVPGTNSAGNRIEMQLNDPPRMEAFSPNGAVRAFNFQFTPTGGLTFVVDYCPDDAGNEFGSEIWLMAHAGDSWVNVDISAPMLGPCDLIEGTVIPSAADPGSFRIVQTSEDCLMPLTE